MILWILAGLLGSVLISRSFSLIGNRFAWIWPSYYELLFYAIATFGGYATLLAGIICLVIMIVDFLSHSKLGRDIDKLLSRPIW